MKISLKNIGKIKEADVEMKGITVIAGENNTGKSTVGKALFSVFNSFHNLKRKIYETREMMIYSAIRTIIDDENDAFVLNGEPVVSRMIKERERYLKADDLSELKELLKINIEFHVWGNENVEEVELDLSEEQLRLIVKKCEEILAVSDEEIYKKILQRQMDAEFNGQITNVYSNEVSEINFVVNGRRIDIEFEGNKVQKLNTIYPLNTQVIYYDNPLIIDELKQLSPRYYRESEYSNHSQFIKACLMKTKAKNLVEEVIQETIVDKKVENLMNQLNKITPGDLDVISARKIIYKLPNDELALNIENLSTGLKSFVIIKTLLSKGFIQENGTIVLDEPEVHLHPEWQLSFAEIIVLLQKEFGLHILLNTHSPYFLRALQVYAGNYGVADKCKYYLAENEGDVATIVDVTEETERIYQKLSRPLQVLENLRW